MSLRNDLVEIYEEAVTSLAGDRLVAAALDADPSMLPDDPRLIVPIALGKAAGGMARGAVAALGPLAGLAVGPQGMDAPGGFEIVLGDHPVPGPRSIRAGIRLLSFVRSLNRNQTALILLSGGGSALAEALPSDLSLVDLSRTTKLLLGAGAPIEEINVLRKHLSRTKGGRLAAACGAGRVVVFTISDVEGDDPAVIASGPFAPDASTFRDALRILDDRKIRDRVPEEVLNHLLQSSDESPKPGDPLFDRVETTILAGPAQLAEAAIAAGVQRGYTAVAWPGFVKGEVTEIAAAYAGWLQQALGKKVLLVAAAEPTVVLPPHPGRGGRSQHLALLMATELDQDPTREAAFLAAGSDGRDGASDNAGAVVDNRSAASARAMGFDVSDALNLAASAAACEAIGASIPAYDSETNLADLHLLALG